MQATVCCFSAATVTMGTSTTRRQRESCPTEQTRILDVPRPRALSPRATSSCSAPCARGTPRPSASSTNATAVLPWRSRACTPATTPMPRTWSRRPSPVCSRCCGRVGARASSCGPTWSRRCRGWPRTAPTTSPARVPRTRSRTGRWTAWSSSTTPWCARSTPPWWPEPSPPCPSGGRRCCGTSRWSSAGPVRWRPWWACSRTRCPRWASVPVKVCAPRTCRSTSPHRHLRTATSTRRSWAPSPGAP